jgi:hypothetical protein
MGVLRWTLFGMVVGPVAVAVAGFLWGGVSRVAPCQTAPDFMSGGVFGALVFTYQFGLLAGVAGAVVGMLIGDYRRWCDSERRSARGLERGWPPTDYKRHDPPGSVRFTADPKPKPGS